MIVEGEHILTSSRKYTFFWATQGKVPLLFRDVILTRPSRIVSLVEEFLPNTIVTKTLGYPIYDDVSGVTVWSIQVRIPPDYPYTVTVGDVYHVVKEDFERMNSPIYRLFKITDSFYIPKGEYSGWVKLPAAIVEEMDSANSDPLSMSEHSENASYLSMFVRFGILGAITWTAYKFIRR